LTYSNKRNLLKQFGIPLAFFAICLGFTLGSNRFLTIPNLTNIARQIAILAILSYGQTFVIIIGGIDISVGTSISLISMGTAAIMVSTGSIALGICMGIFCGTIVGTLNGLLISFLNLQPFIVTLGTMTICKGVALLYNNGMSIVNLPTGFGIIGSGYVGPLPIPVITAFIFFLINSFLLKYTIYGRHTVAIGGNEEAARLSGINIKLIKVVTYSLCGFLSAIAGVVLSSRIISGYPNLGDGLELQSIAAVVIGGANLGGGYGTMLGTLFGVLIIGVIQNGLNILGISSFVQMVVIGLIIIGSVAYDVYRKRKLAE
jgi:ribose transport system permease protein